ncbi:MAG: MarR family winged helix-turn-helix transcriptional regulator [Acidimicrobiales bacterium]
MHPGWKDGRITAFGMLLEAHAVLVAAVGRELEVATKLPLTWFEILIRLARSPGQQLRMTELAAQASLSTSGVSRLVDRLEEVGLIRREACPSDRRGAFAVLTDAGVEALDAAIPVHIESLGRHLGDPLGPDRLLALTGMLEILRDTTRGGPPAPPETCA